MPVAAPKTYPTVLVDNREQCPWTFPRCPSRNATLKEGDYTLEGLEDKIVIERKSLSDFTSSITEERFEREMECLRPYRWKFIVIEANFEDVAEGRYRSLLHPNAAVGLTAALCIRDALCFFASDHTHAADIAERLLLMAAKQIAKERNEIPTL